MAMVCGGVITGCHLLTPPGGGTTTPPDFGPYGNGCRSAFAGERYCGTCTQRSICSYCTDVNGAGTCPADPCGSKCDGTAGADGGVPGTGSGGGTGGTDPAGTGTGGMDSNHCPADAMLECSQWTQNGDCSIQSCTCYGTAPTAYCGVYYRTDRGGFFWCGGGYNVTCSANGIVACAQRVAAACTPPSP